MFTARKRKQLYPQKMEAGLNVSKKQKSEIIEIITDVLSDLIREELDKKH